MVVGGAHEGMSACCCLLLLHGLWNTCVVLSLVHSCCVGLTPKKLHSSVSAKRTRLERVFCNDHMTPLYHVGDMAWFDHHFCLSIRARKLLLAVAYYNCTI
jgi:hypothetical protein